MLIFIKKFHPRDVNLYLRFVKC